MKDRYKAVVLGKDREVLGYDDQGALLLGNGERFKIVPLGIEPQAFSSHTLRAVSRLTFTGGEWLVDGVPLEAYCSRQFASPRTTESDTRLFTAWTLRDVLAEDRPESLNHQYPLPSELRTKATAVAWVEERFEHLPGQARDLNEKPHRLEFRGEIIDMVTEESPPAKAFKPIFLSTFYRIRSPDETPRNGANPSNAVGAVQDLTQREFTYDVFLSHSAKDKPVVRPLAARLRQDGLKVWFDEWVLKPGDSIPAKIEEGLEHSRVLVLCMSANAFGSDWAQLKSGTFRFRDPLNKERRFIPLRFDDAPIIGSLAQFLYINWRPADRDQEYAKLLEACRQPEKWPISENPLFPHFCASAKQEDENLIGRYTQASVEELLADCNRIIQCLTGFDTVFLMSPEGAAEQTRQIDDEWLRGFSRAHEILCLAATARNVNLDPYKQLVNSAYTFWQGATTPKDTESDLKRLFSPGIGALHNLKRALMVKIANGRTAQQGTGTNAKSPSPSSPNERPGQDVRLTRVEINKLVNRYIGVNGGYLADFSYRSHHDFYLDLELEIDPYNYGGTTRERFIKILSESAPDVQARILDGILKRYPVGSSELRTQDRHDEIAAWIARLKGVALPAPLAPEEKPRVGTTVPLPVRPQPRPGSAGSTSNLVAAKHRFDFGISFAKPERDLARQLRDGLRNAGFAVFFDEDFEHEMIGHDGSLYLRNVYSNECRFCIVLISQAYDKREWTNLEREAVQARELRGERGILIPVPIEDYQPAWLPETRIRFDLWKRSVPELVALLTKRAGQPEP